MSPENFTIGPIAQLQRENARLREELVQHSDCDRAFKTLLDSNARLAEENGRLRAALHKIAATVRAAKHPCATCWCIEADARWALADKEEE